MDPTRIVIAVAVLFVVCIIAGVVMHKRGRWKRVIEEFGDKLFQQPLSYEEIIETMSTKNFRHGTVSRSVRNNSVTCQYFPAHGENAEHISVYLQKEFHTFIRTNTGFEMTLGSDEAYYIAPGTREFNILANIFERVRQTIFNQRYS